MDSSRMINDYCSAGRKKDKKLWYCNISRTFACYTILSV